jgi:hypothetical protein
MVRVWIAFVTGLLVLMFWPVAGFGADDAGNVRDEKRVPPFSFDFSVERTARADIDGTGASVAVTEYSAGLSWQFLLIDVDHRENNWRAGSDLGSAPGRDPWGSLTRIAPGLQYYGEFSGQWAIWAKLVAIAGFEDTISSRSWTYNPQLVGFYMPRERLKLYGGIGALYHPVDPVVYPVLGVAWNMDSRSGLSGAIGFPETMLRYHFNEQLAMKVDFQWDIRVYRLAEDNTLAPDGYVRTEDLNPGLHLEYSLTESMMLTTGVRRLMDRGLTIFDRIENERADHDVQDGWSFLVGVAFQL